MFMIPMPATTSAMMPITKAPSLTPRVAIGVVDDARAAQERSDDDAGADGADDAAHAVDAEHVERVVITDEVLETRAGEQADRSNHEAENDCANRTGEAGGRRDRDKTRNSARSHTQQAGFALEHRFGEAPGDSASSRSNERVDQCETSIAVRFEVRAGVEANPADPQEAGADQRERQVVRTHRLDFVAFTFAEDQRANQSGDARVDVDHRAAREVERAEGPDQASAIQHRLGVCRIRRHDLGITPTVKYG